MVSLCVSRIVSLLPLSRAVDCVHCMLKCNPVQWPCVVEYNAVQVDLHVSYPDLLSSVQAWLLMRISSTQQA